MSFLRGNAPPPGAVNPEKIELATAELDMITDVFNRITSSCYSKCIGARFTGGELNKGESVCVDRCVAKYFEVNKMIGEKLQQMGAGAQTAGQKSFTSL